MKSSTTGTWLKTCGGAVSYLLKTLTEIKDDSRPVILSAHGVPKAVETEAARRKLTVIDATCPLVAKVHRQIRKLAEEGRKS